jgi:hypothetical protein
MWRSTSSNDGPSELFLSDAHLRGTIGERLVRVQGGHIMVADPRFPERCLFHLVFSKDNYRGRLLEFCAHVCTRKAPVCDSRNLDFEYSSGLSQYNYIFTRTFGFASNINMSHIQPEPQPSTGFYGKSNDAGVVDNVDKTGAGIAVSSENEHNGASTTHNPVLEQVAQEKGRWFQYVKTKQFWITLLLGQGTMLPFSKPIRILIRPQ